MAADTRLYHKWKVRRVKDTDPGLEIMAGAKHCLKCRSQGSLDSRDRRREG